MEWAAMDYALQDSVNLFSSRSAPVLFCSLVLWVLIRNARGPRLILFDLYCDTPPQQLGKPMVLVQSCTNWSLEFSFYPLTLFWKSGPAGNSRAERSSRFGLHFDPRKKRKRKKKAVRWGIVSAKNHRRIECLVWMEDRHSLLHLSFVFLTSRFRNWAFGREFSIECRTLDLDGINHNNLKKAVRSRLRSKAKASEVGCSLSHTTPRKCSFSGSSGQDCRRWTHSFSNSRLHGRLAGSRL